MKIQSTVKSALNALNANKGRTGLTVLGMFIGIASVIIVFSAGEGIKSLILGQVEMFGTDIIEAEIKIPTGKKGTAGDVQSASAMAMGVQITSLNLNDMEDVSRLPNIKNAYAVVTGQEEVGYGNELEKATVYAVSASYVEIDNSEVEFGRFYSESEDKSLSKVIVLGSKMKKSLFGDSDAVGKTVSFHKSKYRVIGVMKARGSMAGFDFDELVYVPVRTMQKKIMGIDHVMAIIYQLHDVSIADETAEEARLILRNNHDIVAPPKDPNTPKTIGEGPTNTIKDDFRVVTMKESMDVLGTVTNAITLLLLAIVAISLVVGGVGITNILYVVVTERTAEIGLRKAVGATYKDIMYQILFESILITLLAGLIGIVIGIAISYIITLVARSYGLSWRFVVPLKAYITAIVFSLIFGVLFGLFPARKAARLQPIEAMRKE